jgi:hypothetical protein
MNFIRPIGSEPELDPLARVQRLKDEQREREERREAQQKDRRPQTADRQAPVADPVPPEGPVEGDDGHLHIDIKA